MTNDEMREWIEARQRGEARRAAFLRSVARVAVLPMVLVAFFALAIPAARAGGIDPLLKPQVLKILRDLGIIDSSGAFAGFGGPGSSTSGTIPVWDGTGGDALTTSTLSSPAAGTLLAPTALVVGAASTSGVRLDLEGGSLAAREGDDSAYVPFLAYGVSAGGGAANEGVSINYDDVGVRLGASAPIAWTSDTPSGTPDVGLARSAAGIAEVTNGGSGDGSLIASVFYAGGSTGGVQITSDRIIFTNTGNGRIQAIAGGIRVVSTQNSETRIFSAETISTALTSGATYTFTGSLPDGAIILGVSARITTTITGPTSVQVGDGTDADRYGVFSTLTAGQTVTPADATASPLEWRAAAGDVVLTAVGGGGAFTAGAVRISVHYLSGTAPGS